MPHQQAPSLEAALRSALLGKNKWNLERAEKLASEVCEITSYSYDYDDGPPENWINLMAPDGEWIGMICVLAPLALVQNIGFSKEIEGIFAQQEISFVIFDDWKDSKLQLKSDLMSNLFDFDFFNYLGKKDDEEVSVDEFWYMTVT